MIKKAQLLHVWLGCVRLKCRWNKIFVNVNFACRVKRTKINSEICWFKLCSSKLTITSLKRRANTFLWFPQYVWFSKRGGRIWADALQHARKSKPSKWPRIVIWQRPLNLRTEFFSSYHWCWKLRNYWETRNIAIVRTSEFYSRKSIWYLAKYLVFARQQKVQRVAENKNNVLYLPRLVKV